MLSPQAVAEMQAKHKTDLAAAVQEKKTLQAEYQELLDKYTKVSEPASSGCNMAALSINLIGGSCAWQRVLHYPGLPTPSQPTGSWVFRVS